MKNSKLKKMKERYVWLIVLLIGFGLILVSFLSQWRFSDTNFVLEKGRRVELEAGDILRQKFIATENGLSSLGILLGGRDLPEKHFVDFILTDKECKQEIAKTTLSPGWEFNSADLYDFNFSPLDNSAQREYCLIVGHRVEVGGIKKGKVRLFANKFNSKFTNVDLGYVILKNNAVVEKSKQAIVFRPKYQRPTIWQNIIWLNKRISQYKPWFFKGYWLIGLGAIMLIVNFFLIYKLFLEKDNFK
jgi:hypothetical protein